MNVLHVCHSIPLAHQALRDLYNKTPEDWPRVVESKLIIENVNGDVHYFDEIRTMNQALGHAGRTFDKIEWESIPLVTVSRFLRTLVKPL